MNNLAQNTFSIFQCVTLLASLTFIGLCAFNTIINLAGKAYSFGIEVCVLTSVACN